MPEVQVLLATYNGALHLEDQIQSIIDQDFKDFEIIIHDDGSSDGTTEIIKRFEVAYPSLIRVIVDGVKTGSAKANFFHLLSRSSANYVCFSDQDDVWDRRHISLLLSECVQAESREGHGRPVGAFADLRIVDERGAALHPSLWRYQCTNPKALLEVGRLSVTNCVTGCSLMVNRAAVDMTLQLDLRYAVMHDHFMALSILAHGGVLIPVDEPLVDYRQHQLNVVGARSFTVSSLLSKMLKLGSTAQAHEEAYLQARYLDAASGRAEFAFRKAILLARRLIASSLPRRPASSK